MKNKQILLSLLFPIVFLCVLGSASSLRSQWVPTGGPGTGASVESLAAIGTNIFAGSMGGPNGYPGGMYISTNNGANWLPRNSGLTDTAVLSTAVIGNDLFAGTLAGGVFRSTNYGLSWFAVNTGLPNPTIYSLLSSGNNLFAGTNDGIYLSTNSGSTWVLRGLTGNLIFALGVIGSNIFAGASGDGVYRTTDNGANWQQVNSGLTNTAVQSLTASGTDLYAGTFSGVFRTTNIGANWINTGGLAGLIINTVTASGGNVFAGSSGGGIFLTTNSGANWTSVGVGMPNTTINTLIISGQNIFAGALSGMVYRRTLSEMVTSVSLVSSEVPVDFSMSQNYPNPFNPSTTIKFDVQHNSYVKLSIYDVLGKKVAVLADQDMTAGRYEVTWNAVNFASGAYFYRLETDGFADMKKMILVK